VAFSVVSLPPVIVGIGFGRLLTQGQPIPVQITGFARGVTVGADAYSSFGGSVIYSPLQNTFGIEVGVAAGLNVGFNVSLGCLMSDPITELTKEFFRDLVC